MDWGAIFVQAVMVVFLAGVFVGTTRGQTKLLVQSIKNVADSLRDHKAEDVRLHTGMDMRVRDLERTIPRLQTEPMTGPGAARR